MGKGIIVSKKALEENYPLQWSELNKLFGSNWYIYQKKNFYHLVVGECETSFISLKLDLSSLLDGISFGILLSKHKEQWNG